MAIWVVRCYYVQPRKQPLSELYCWLASHVCVCVCVWLCFRLLHVAVATDFAFSPLTSVEDSQTDLELTPTADDNTSEEVADDDW